MPTQSFKVIDSDISIDQLKEEFAKLQKILRWLLNGSLDFENIVARGIKAENIEAGTITAEEIATGTITADKMNVSELSAISANLGKVIAGILIGAYISTADGTFPRIDFSSSGNLLTAYATSTNYLKIDPSLSFPSIVATNGTVSGAVSLFTFLSTFYAVVAQNGGLRLQSTTDDVTITAGSGKFVRIEDFDRLYSDGDGQTLQSALNNLQSQINGKANAFSGFTGTFFVSSTLGGAIDQEVTVTNGIITSVV